MGINSAIIIYINHACTYILLMTYKVSKRSIKTDSVSINELR